MGGVYRKFKAWVTTSYWHFQGFFIGFAAVLGFLMFLTRTGSLNWAVPAAALTLVGCTAWSVWARRWGKFRDRDPWEDP